MRLCGSNPSWAATFGFETRERRLTGGKGANQAPTATEDEMSEGVLSPLDEAERGGPPQDEQSARP